MNLYVIIKKINCLQEGRPILKATLEQAQEYIQKQSQEYIKDIQMSNIEWVSCTGWQASVKTRDAAEVQWVIEEVSAPIKIYDGLLEALYVLKLHLINVAAGKEEADRNKMDCLVRFFDNYFDEAEELGLFTYPEIEDFTGEIIGRQKDLYDFINEEYEQSKDHLDTEIWGIRFSWYDALALKGQEFSSFFLALPKAWQKEIIQKHSYSIGKGLENGMMADSDFIMGTAMSLVNLFDTLTDKVVVLKDGRKAIIQGVILPEASYNEESEDLLDDDTDQAEEQNPEVLVKVVYENSIEEEIPFSAIDFSMAQAA